MPFLCPSCEERFSRCGERVVGAECFRPGEGFVLRDKLRQVPPRHSRGEEAWFSAADLAAVDVPAYHYFAASMFWRASAGKWPEAGSRASRGSLGQRYEGAFADYLLGRASLPAQARLALFVANDPDPIQLSTVPTVKNDAGFHIHTFLAPGIEFRMFLGRSMTPDVSTLFQTWNTETLFVLQNSHRTATTDGIADVVRRSTLRGRLARQRGSSHA
jgi:hypothetical protein